MDTTNKKRNSSIELLRIISMFLIVICHFATHGNFSFDRYEITLPRLWWYLIEAGGDIGNNVFVIISGYFLSASSNEYNLNTYLKKIIKFSAEVTFYSVTIYLIFVAFGASEFSFFELLTNLFPISFEKMWFASTYFVLYIIHPFINKLIHSLDKLLYQKMLAVLLILWCVIPTFTNLSFGLNSVIWFVVLYCVAGYYRNYGFNEKIDRKKCLIIFIVASILRYSSAIVLMLIGTKISYFSIRTLYFYSINSILTFVSSITLFAVFEKTELKHNNFINLIGSTTFGVYLIHDNDFVRPYLWESLFKNNQHQTSLAIIPYSILCSIIVFVVCAIIDLIRQKILEEKLLKNIGIK